VAKLNFDDIRRGYRKLDYFLQPILFLMARNRWVPKITWPPKVRLFFSARAARSLSYTRFSYIQPSGIATPTTRRSALLPSLPHGRRTSLFLLGRPRFRSSSRCPTLAPAPPPSVAQPSSLVTGPSLSSSGAPPYSPLPPSPPPPPPIYLAPAPSKQRKIRTDNITIFVWVSLKKIGP
jgi:hypothetical protein